MSSSHGEGEGVDWIHRVQDDKITLKHLNFQFSWGQVQIDQKLSSPKDIKISSSPARGGGSGSVSQSVNYTSVMAM